MKFADGSEITIEVRCEPAEVPHGAPFLLTLAVADGGRGMSVEECARAFERDFRAPTHKGGGTGLGACLAAHARVY